ncbi:hypothetical protein Lal_00031876 [Lupinus albus]|nr:hypothetical protein Lal_00031876 [Lupinus albus]
METSSEVVGYSSTLLVKNKVKFEVKVFDVNCLVELIPKIPQDVKDQFAKDYGRLIDLLLITIDATAQHVMGAMEKYWNPSQTVAEGKGDWDLFKSTFALAIYDKILFPFVNDIVDQCAIDVINKFKKFGANLVPVILADTHLALQRSIENGIPKIICCAQLLKTNIPPMQLSNWEVLFNEFTPRNFGTKCNMCDKYEEVMYSFLQIQLQGFVVWYKNKETTKETLDAMRNALRSNRVVGKSELGEHQVFYTDEYKLWRNKKRKGKTIPPVSPPQELNKVIVNIR